MRKRYSIWINASFIILATFLWNTFAISNQGDEEGISSEELQCIAQCYSVRRRQCLTPPSTCGSCVDNHVNVDGTCKPKTMAVAETVPYVKRQLEEALERKRRKEDLDTAAAAGSGGAEGGDMLVGGGVKTAREEWEDYPSSDHNSDSQSNTVVIDDAVFIGVIAAFCAAAVIGVLVAIICYCKMRRSAKDASDMDYSSSYGSSLVGGKRGLNDGYPTKPPAVDRKLAQSAQMFHYQHQKQQMLEMEKAAEVAAKSDEEGTSEDDNADDQYTVYECPGLASTGEMEVRNPLYMEDSPLPPSVSSTPPPPYLGPGEGQPPSNCLDSAPPTTTTATTSSTSGGKINGHHTDKQ